MMPRRPLQRFAFATLAVLQLLLSAGASWADARENLSGRSRWSAVHIESTRDSDCPRGHPDNCMLCQYATHVAVASGPLRVAIGFAEAATRGHGGVSTVPFRIVSTLGNPRAPPLS